MTPADFALSMTRDLLLPDAVAPHIASSIEAQLVQVRSVALPTAAQIAADAELGPVLISVPCTLPYKRLSLTC